MFNNRTAVTQIVVVLAALIVGTAFGHWITVVVRAPINSVAASATIPAVAAKAISAADDAVLSTGSFSEIAKSVAASLTPKKSLDEILKGRNPQDRTKELQEFINNLNSSEFGTVLKRLRQMPQGNARELATRLLIARWAETDPESALQFAAQNHEFDYITSDVFQQLATGDLQSALARAQSIQDSNLRYQALRGVLSYMADADPIGALKLAGTFGSFPNNEPLSQVIYRQWSSIDPQAAALQASQDPAGGGWRSPIGQVLRNWATQDPLAAINWSLSIADAAAQGRDIGQIIREWSRQDLNAAANWVNNAAPGGARDAAAAALAFSIASTDPRAAIGWIGSIADATQRNNSLQRISREIVYRDPANGAAMLLAAGVPANMIPPPPDPNQAGGRGRRQ